MTSLPPDSAILTQMLEAQKRTDAALAHLTTIVGKVVEERNAPPPEREPTDEELRERPTLLLQKLKNQMDRSIAPLNEFKENAERQANYLGLKNAVKNSDPRFVKLWDKIEPQLDHAFMTSSVNPTLEILKYHVSAILGNIILNNPDALKDTSLHIPPSAPITPEVPKPGARELTENEKIIARSKGWSAEKYLEETEKASKGDQAFTRSAK